MMTATDPVSDRALVEAVDMRLAIERAKALLRMSIVDPNRMPPGKATLKALEELECIDTAAIRVYERKRA